jgi:hypothetical protein
VNDELGPDVLDSHQEHYDAINVADPDHPSWNLHNKPQEMTSMINSCDAMGVDEYPVPDNKLSDVSKAVENTVDATRNSRAVWAVPQICNLGVHYGSKMPDARPPKLFELRSMAWQAICAGADGLIFYCLHDCLKDEKFPFQQQWPNIRRMSLEIDKYAPVLLSIEELPEIKVNAPAWLKWTARNYQGTVYIFAVNSGKDSGTASFSVAGKIQSVEKIRLNEDKAKQKIDSNPSSWKDKILPDEVCIYLVKLK